MKPLTDIYNSWSRDVTFNFPYKYKAKNKIMHKVITGIVAAAALGLATHQTHQNTHGNLKVEAPVRIVHHAVGLRLRGHKTEKRDKVRCDVVYDIISYKIKSGNCVTFVTDELSGPADWCGDWVIL